MFLLFLATLMMIFGGMNVMSEQASYFGWISLAVGFVLLVAKLSGPSKPKKYGKRVTTAAISSQSSGGYASDYSAGDGGGDCGGGGGE